MDQARMRGSVTMLAAAVALGACAPDNEVESMDAEEMAVSIETVEPAMDAAPMAIEDDIVDVAIGAGSFETLVTAVQAAGLVETLRGEGPFTVFAPTDEAFAKLPEGTVEGLLEDPEQLAAILTYHVVAGEVTSNEVVELTEAQTVNGAMLDIRVENGNVMVNDAMVTQTDIQASNGVIHVIDSVILPPS